MYLYLCVNCCCFFFYYFFVIFISCFGYTTLIVLYRALLDGFGQTADIVLKRDCVYHNMHISERSNEHHIASSTAQHMEYIHRQDGLSVAGVLFKHLLYLTFRPTTKSNWEYSERCKLVTLYIWVEWHEMYSVLDIEHSRARNWKR